MNRKFLKWILVILGVSSALLSIGISIHTYNNPSVANTQLLLQLPLLLILVSLVSSIALNRLRKADGKIHSKQ